MNDQLMNPQVAEAVLKEQQALFKIFSQNQNGRKSVDRDSSTSPTVNKQTVHQSQQRKYVCIRIGDIVGTRRWGIR